MGLCILIVLACCLVANAKDFRTLDHLQPSATNVVQTEAAQQLILRVVKDRASRFVVNVDPSIGPKNRDTFRLVTDSGRLNITGTTGVAVVMGFYYYLAQYCGCHISWGGNQVNFPSELPVIAVPGVVVTSNDKLRYFANVCTMSYSFAWWSWSQWESFIDWLAMSGFNMPLAFSGQEAIWQRVYLKMGFTQTDLDKHFAGPAFLAWQRMGNMYGWGGPLPQNWHLQQVALQHKILDRMRSLGMIPVLPAFAGHVPRAFPRLFPNHNVTHMYNWGHFNATYCCTLLLSAEDPLFAVIGKAFLLEYRKEFGTDHLYNADNFNEMPPASSDPKYIAAFGKATFASMLAADQDAIWVMQSWLFQDRAFWKPTQAKALLTSVPLGRMIVLDLSSEVKPTYNSLESYFGQPFIWCMLHDYGGVVDWYGMVDSINKGPFVGRAFPNSTMVGIGLTMEGINQNYVIYEFMNENLWRKEPRDVNKWFSSYAFRRYGVYEDSVAQAWVLLAHSIYNCTTSCQWHGQDTIIIEKPRYQHAIIPRVWYNMEDLFGAWDLFVTSAKPSLSASALYRYDLVDLTRQSLEIIANKYYSDLLTHYKAQDLHNTISSGRRLLSLLADLETLLAADEHFLLGCWLEDAKALGTNNAEKQLYEYNARNQITLWGPRANVLDYANKQWSGMVKSYYQPRWALFVERLVQSLKDKTPFDEAQFNKDVFSQVEQPFTYDRTLWPTQPTGDAVELAKQIHKSYRPATVEYADFFRRLQRPQTARETQTGHSYEYDNAVQQEIMYGHHVELRVIGDVSDVRPIL